MTISGRRSGTQFFADRDFCHIANRDGQATTRHHHQLAQVINSADLAGNANQQLFLVAFQIACALIGIIETNRLRHPFKGEPVGHQLCRVRLHVELLGKAPNRVDLGHARHLLQLRPNHPILERAQSRGIVGRAVRLAGVSIRLHRIQEDFTQTGGGRPHARFHIIRQTTPNLLQALADQLTGKIDVGSFLERDSDL